MLTTFVDAVNLPSIILVGTLNYWCTSISCYYMQQQQLSRIQKPPKHVTDNFCEGDLKFALYPRQGRGSEQPHTTTQLNNQCSRSNWR